MEFLRRVYENGKVTVPKEVRDLYGLAEGDMVKLKIIEVYPAGRAEEARKEPVESATGGDAE